MYVCFDNPVTFLQASALDTSGPVIYSWAPAATLKSLDSSYTVAHPDSTQLYVLTVLMTMDVIFYVKDSVCSFMYSPVPALQVMIIAVSGQPRIKMMASGGANMNGLQPSRSTCQPLPIRWRPLQRPAISL